MPSRLEAEEMDTLAKRTACGVAIFLLVWMVSVSPAQESAVTDSPEKQPEDADQSGDPAAKPSDAPTDPDEPPAKTDDTPRTKRQPTVSEILRAFQEEERPVLTPISGGRAGQGGRTGPRGSRDEDSGYRHPRLPDGHYLVDRVGWLGQEGSWHTFVFESEAAQEPQPPMKLLPNRMLEWMVRESKGSTEQVSFKVSGEVTDFFGENFLLLRKSLRKRNLGNLKR